jgi:hypothetical protein
MTSRERAEIHAALDRLLSRGDINPWQRAEAYERMDQGIDRARTQTERALRQRQRVLSQGGT